MTVLAERAGAASLVLEEFADLPVPSIVDIRRGKPVVGVRFQLDTLDELIEWALKFGVAVRFTENFSYVHVGIEIAVFDVTMAAWSHLTHVDAFEVLNRWGYKLSPDGVVVPAAHAHAMQRRTIAS